MASYELLNEYDNVDAEVKLKRDDRPLTVADRHAHTLIYESLSTQFPDIDVASEEGECALSDGKDGVFLLDPLDGTKEFLKRTGEFTVNIALICSESTELGVGHVTVEKTLYSNTIDGGVIIRRSATLENEFGVEGKIRCRTVSISGPTEVISVSHSSKDTIEYASPYNPAETVSAGSSLKFCRVTESCADIYPRLGESMEWDTAAANAVLKEAGGNVFNLKDGDEICYGKPELDNGYFLAASLDLALKKNGLCRINEKI